MDPYRAVPDIGQLYDHARPYATRRDVGFYVDAVGEARGPVLELGCGTGRVLLPCARAGASITGLDASPPMLQRCAAKLSTEPAAVRERVRLVEGDLRVFELGERFALITIPFRPLQHLLEVEDQLRCLLEVSRHLAPGGRLVFDVFNPDFDRLVAAPTVEQEDTPETPLPDGRSFRRTYRILQVHRVAQRSDVELTYHVTEADGAVARHSTRFAMRWFLRSELEHLLARAGLRVRELYGDFDRSPLVDGSPEIIVVAEPEDGA